MKKFLIAALALSFMASESQACWLTCKPCKSQRYCQPAPRVVVQQPTIIYSYSVQSTPVYIQSCNNGTCQPVRQVVVTVIQSLPLPCPNGRCPNPQR